MTTLPTIRLGAPATHFVDKSGRYLGGFADGARPPRGARIVPLPPNDARQIWTGDAWSALPAAVPDAVTPAQALAALYRAGRLADVEAAVTAAGGEVAIWFQRAATWRRDNPHVATIAAALDPPLAAADVDALFVVAAAIDA